jgi:hypothetical protein
MSRNDPEAETYERSRRAGAVPGRSRRPSAAVESIGFGRDGRGWVGVGVATGLLVAVSYLLSHPYPAYGAGLYLEIAQQIRAHGYALPSTVPHYTGGVPLAYPPLQFYVAALLLDAGVSGLVVSRTVPAVVTVLYLVPYYGIARQLLPTRRQAGLATVLLALAPPTLQWHLSAGGIVRGSAFLLALCGIHVGIRLFRGGQRRWVAPGAVLFGLTVLSHPVYAVYFGLSWLVLYASFDRTARGLARGAAVAGGGLLLAAPWLVTVVTRHGPDVIFGAAGSHSGLAGGVDRLLDQFVYTIEPTPVGLFFVAVFVAAIVSLARRQYVLPAWLFVGAYVVGKERFQFVPGAMLVASVLLTVVVPRLDRSIPDVDRRQLTTGVVVVVLLAGGAVGTLYATSALGSAHHGSPSLPAFLDGHDRDAMAWAASETAPDDSFVVLGDAAEWFPYYTDRPMLVGPWGVEWVSPRQYYAQLDHYRSLSTCDSAGCVSDGLAAADVSPTYVYVPSGDYTVRGLEVDGTATLRRSMAASNRYRRVYGNDGVTVFRVVDGTPRRPPIGGSASWQSPGGVASRYSLVAIVLRIDTVWLG